MTKYILDLDKTIWNCKDDRGGDIWAKDMHEPHVLAYNVITDPYGSKCVLDRNVRSVLETLRHRGHDIGFLSVGGLWDTRLQNQPSVALLKTFDIYQYFNAETILGYYTDGKNKYLEKMVPCVFIDDNDTILAQARKVEGVTIIDRKRMKSWIELLD